VRRFSDAGTTKPTTRSGSRRPKFIAGVAGVAAWPVMARAQQRTTPIVGFLDARSAAISAPDSEAFRKGLAETGYVEGSNVAIESRFSDGQVDRLPSLATELVRRQVAVIFSAWRWHAISCRRPRSSLRLSIRSARSSGLRFDMRPDRAAPAAPLRSIISIATFN
jgi:hypothetical protein